jgi:hypothetical protein
MMNFFSALTEKLTNAWKPAQTHVSKRGFHCVCGKPIFFRNSQCLSCNSPLGYAPSVGELRALEAGEKAGTWHLADTPGTDLYKRCDNFNLAAGCNWLVPTQDPFSLCISCRLNRTLLDLTDTENKRYWRLIEAAKRRLISQLLALGLPVQSKAENPELGLAFDILRSPENGPRVSTGHANGLITLNAEEANDVTREQIRTSLHEPYRTLVGHFRHEIGHYYWDHLIRDTRWIEPFRELFGDERADYSAAIKKNYEQGPPADWRDRYISSYASTHPWEDWAECWAHYLHIIDSLDTAIAHGLDGADIDLEAEPFTHKDLYQPDSEDADRVLFFINSWVEMVTVLNEMARSLGQADFYPFVMPRAVVKKLHFIHLVVSDATRN